MQSEIDSLRQRISKLETEKAELEAKNAELLKQVMQESTKREAENVELKARIEELEKNKTNTINLKVENDELKAGVTKLEQSQNNTTHGLGDCILREASSDISSNINACSPNSKTLEDIETDNFLDSESRKRGTRKRNFKLKGHIIPLYQCQLRRYHLK
ncbi:hypothetical protein Glove_161g18 [Diversispora epigaea]|uniref:Uncharacterized protein n=1 Tax=Diversispora epigaea TaxID=1348612 RepID=A0A397IRE4_9GLOM|nr:hypothetical protein Glove_161g18 [Diversispora epigaea]